MIYDKKKAQLTCASCEKLTDSKAAVLKRVSAT